MAKLRVFLLSLVIVFGGFVSKSFSETTDETNILGAGVLISSSPYKDHDMKVWPVPIISWKNKNFFIKGTEAGWIAYENDNFRADVLVKPHLMGYDSGDSSFLAGMEDRNFSIDGGGKLTWKIPQVKDLDLSLTLVTDLLNEYQGHEAVLGLTKVCKGDIYQIQSSVGVKWESQDLVKYYYGVRAGEITSSRPSYDGADAFDPYVQLGFFLGISKDLIFVGQFTADYLASQITDSPIVDESHILTGVVGIAKRF